MRPIDDPFLNPKPGEFPVIEKLVSKQGWGHIPPSTTVSTRAVIALVAVGRVVSSSFTAVAIVMIGCSGSISNKRAAITVLPGVIRTRSRSRLTRAKRSRAVETASPAIVETASSVLHKDRPSECRTGPLSPP